MKPQFYDVTLRDGNQALKKSWDLFEKEIIFKQLLKLGVDGVEVGFASASKKDFEACKHLAKISSDKVVISSLSRAVPKEIEASYQAIKYAKKPRIHIVYPVSDFAIQNVLKISYKKVLENVKFAIEYAKSISKDKTEIQFSGEHFGDSIAGVEFQAEVFQTAFDAGAKILNLPNTVERYRPKTFWDMILSVKEKISRDAIYSVHTHNDLGMATAVTVESFFLGVTQLETSLNGLGERAGNTNLYEVAIALFNSGVELDLNLEEIYPTALLVSKMSGIPIHEKAALIGSDVFSHRSGIHQDGVIKTSHLKKNAYGTIDPELIGRKEGHQIRITSQSGSKAMLEILKQNQFDISNLDIEKFQTEIKNYSDYLNRELSSEEVLRMYESKFLEIANSKF